MTCIGWCDTPEMCEDSASCLKAKRRPRTESALRFAALPFADGSVVLSEEARMFDAPLCDKHAQLVRGPMPHVSMGWPGDDL